MLEVTALSTVPPPQINLLGIAWVDSTSSSTSIGACLSFDLPTYQRAGFLHALIYGKIELVPTSETSKNRQMSIKLPKNDFSRKFKIWTPLPKLPKNVGDLGKLIVGKGFERLPKVQ